MFEKWALAEMDVPQAFTEILAKEIILAPFVLQFRNGYEVTRCKQLLYSFRRHRCPGFFRISQWGFLLVIIPRHKPSPTKLDNILMIKVPMKGDEWCLQLNKILQNPRESLFSSSDCKKDNFLEENLLDIFHKD